MILPILQTFFREKRYRYLTIATLSVLATGIIGFRFLEDWRWLDCINYAVSVMVTSGNAEVYPKTDAGKVFNIFYMLLSVILILLFVNTLYQHFHNLRLSKEVKDKRHQKIVEKQIDVQSNNEHTN